MFTFAFDCAGCGVASVVREKTNPGMEESICGKLRSRNISKENSPGAKLR